MVSNAREARIDHRRCAFSQAAVPGQKNRPSSARSVPEVPLRPLAVPALTGAEPAPKGRDYPGTYQACQGVMLRFDWADLKSRFPADQFGKHVEQAVMHGIKMALGLENSNTRERRLEPNELLTTGFSYTTEEFNIMKKFGASATHNTITMF